MSDLTHPSRECVALEAFDDFLARLNLRQMTGENRLRAMAAALSAADQVGWQPIETAPGDTIVLLWWPYWTHLPCFGALKRHPTRTVLRWVSDVALSEEGPGPTHWRSLPLKPGERR